MFKGLFKYIGRAMAIGAVEHMAKKGYLRQFEANLFSDMERLKFSDMERLKKVSTARNSKILENSVKDIELSPAHTISLGTLEPYPFCSHPAGQDEYISESIRNTGIWEPAETEILLRLFPLYDLFLDFGANIGWFSAIASRAMRAGAEIYAFEPDPRNFQLLRQNIGSTPLMRLCCVQSAVADTIGTVRLFQAGTNLGDHRLHSHEPGRSSIEVPVTTLDAYFSGRTLPPRLVKLDTQGSEARVFRGAQVTLFDNDPASAYLLEFEVFGLQSSGENIADYVSLLSRLPQTPFIIDKSENVIRPTSWPDLLARAEREADQTNDNLILITLGSAAHLALADLIARE
jgi:FkbM family methyltransferase